MLLKSFVHFPKKFSFILTQCGKLGVSLLFEGRAHSEYTVFTFLKGDKLLTRSNTTPAMLCITLSVVGAFLLEEIGSQLQFLSKFFLLLLLLEDS
mgnify:FL=1